MFIKDISGCSPARSYAPLPVYFASAKPPHLFGKEREARGLPALPFLVISDVFALVNVYGTNSRSMLRNSIQHFIEIANVLRFSGGDLPSLTNNPERTKLT
jgi:hypothetical protein